MNLLPALLTTMFDSRAKDPICCIEFYEYSYIPDASNGFEPDEAVALFATETTTFTYLGNTVNYAREVFQMPSLSRNMGKQSNSVTVKMSNVPTADDPSVRPLANFVLNNEVEGMRMVIRVLSRSNLSNPLLGPLACSFIAFVGKCTRPEGFDRQSGSITAKQDLGQIEAQIPPRVFQKPCPLRFKGEECLGTEVLGDKSATYQAATVCNKTHTQCDEYENTEFFQGIRVVQIQGSFRHRPHQGFFSKLAKFTVPLVYAAFLRRKNVTVGHSLEDGTPYGKAIPQVLGRWQLSGMPLQYRDDGETIHFLMAWCRGLIGGIFNLRVNNPEFVNPPVTVVHHYGDYGGEADQLEDTVFPQGGFYSRLAYTTGGVIGSDIAVEDPVPDISAVIAGSVVGKMTTAHLMNRCGSGRVSGGGISYAALFSGSWTDNPADLTRVLLTDPSLLNLNENFIDQRRAAIAAFYCSGAIKDDSNAERLLLPTTENGKAGVDYKRYNSTSLITPGVFPVTTGQFPASRTDHEAKYEYFDPDNPPEPGDIAVKTFYRKRWTTNLALTDQRKVIDVLFDTVLPSYRGYLTWNNRGQIAINCEKPSDSTLLATSSVAGATTIDVLDVNPYYQDINETGIGQSLVGKILIGVGLLTSEVRRVTMARYNPTIQNAITLAASGTGGTTAVASGATLSGGDPTGPALGSITIGGTLAEGDTVTATIDGIDVTYTLQANEAVGFPAPPESGVAAALAFAINAHPILGKYVEANNAGWHDHLEIAGKVGTLTLSSALEEDHDADEETIRVMMSFADKALTYADTTESNIIDGSFKYLGGNGQTRYNQFKGTYHDPLRDFAEQPLIINDYDHQDSAEKIFPLDIDLSAVDNYNQASRLLNGAAAKFGDGTDFFTWRSNGLALQLEEGDVVCVSHPAGSFRNVPVRNEQVSWNEKYEITFTDRIYSTSMFNDAVEATDVIIPSGVVGFAEPPVSIEFNTTDFPPNGLVQSTDGTAGITSIRGGAIFPTRRNATYATVRLIKRAGVTVNEQVGIIYPDDNLEAVFEFIASADGLYTVELEVCNQWGCNTTKPTADIIIGFGTLFGIAKQGGILITKQGGTIMEKQHA